MSYYFILIAAVCLLFAGFLLAVATLTPVAITEASPKPVQYTLSAVLFVAGGSLLYAAFLVP